jgi:Flp pilus assembly protein TadG
MRHALEGQALVIFALVSLVLVGMMALSIDAGLLIAERRQVQAAADAAAMAAAKAAFDSKSSAEILATGQNYGSFNAVVATGNVTVSRPPTSGAYAGNNNYIQVTITKDVTRYFVGAVYSGAWSVSATATAGIETNPGNYALITLEPTATDGIYMNGNTGIIITNNSGSAMSNSNIRGSNNTNFNVAGTIDANSTISSVSGWVAPGGIHPNFPEITDPLAGTAVPSKGTARTFPNCNSGCTLQPGWYRNQSLTVRGTATLQAGVYYFENSSIDLQNTNARIQCTGCLTYWDASSAFDPKNGEVNFTAPTSSPYTGGQNGMVFWYARCNNLDLQGNGEIYFRGIFYAPCALVTLHGNPSNDTISGQIIVDQLDVRGTSDLRISYNSYVTTTRPAIFLVE